MITTTAASSVALWGPDHVDPDKIAAAAIDRSRAVALSRGGPKDRPYTDPNEDVVAIAVRGDRVLLAVADGHRGGQASTAAIRFLLEELEPLPWTLEPDAARELLGRVADAAHRVVEDGGSSRSRTTLAVALVSGDDVWWATLGDSAVYVVDGSGARRLDSPTERYLGAALRPAEIRAAASVGRIALAADAWVCAASDGFTDYSRPSPLESLDAVLGGPDGRALDASVAARRLVEADVAGGAGDNVAVALVRI